MRTLSLLTAKLAVFALCATANPGHQFVTEPDIEAAHFDVSIRPNNASQLAPGYIFLDFLHKDEAWGSHIYTIDGTLIWHGSYRNRTQNTHVCNYRGINGSHLCFTQRHDDDIGRFPDSLSPAASALIGDAPLPEVTYPHLTVLDETYTEIQAFDRGFGEYPFDVHAFEMVGDGNSLTTIAKRLNLSDLRPWGGSKNGWVQEQCIEEIDVKTARSVFHWCWLGSGSDVSESTKLGCWDDMNHHGNNQDNPVDILHSNAVVKNSEGDYYVSVRHVDQIIKIAGPQSRNGKPGDILWRLGGVANEFKLQGFWNATFPFSRQHDVRSISATGSEEVISLYNNAYDAMCPPSQKFSEGQIIHVNSKSMKARLLRSYPHPERALSDGRGSVQSLPNGNILIGWGAKIAELSEFDHNGTLLYHASYRLSSDRPSDMDLFSYKTLKYPWIGKPHWDPKLVANTCLNFCIAHVSWNGATEISDWRFSTATKRSAARAVEGTVAKAGFETKALLAAYRIGSGNVQFVTVEALDASGAVLGKTTVETGVANPEVCERERSHLRNGSFRPSAEHPYSPSFLVAALNFKALLGLILLVTLVENLAWIMHVTTSFAVGSRAGDESYESLGAEVPERSDPNRTPTQENRKIRSHPETCQEV